MNIEFKRRLPILNPHSEILLVMKLGGCNRAEKYFRKQILLGKCVVLLIVAFTSSSEFSESNELQRN